MGEICKLCNEKESRLGEFILCESCYGKLKYAKQDLSIYKRSLLIKCGVCGNDFEKKIWNQIVCSKTCKYKLDNAKRRNAEIPLPLDQIECTCGQCGVKFKPISKFVPNRKFCSDYCRNKFTWRKNQNYKGGPKVGWSKGKKMSAEFVEKNRLGHLGQIPWNKVINDIKCSFCGGTFHMKPSLMRDSKFHYCSTKCMGDHRAILLIGENNPFYGKSHPMKGIKRTEEVKNKISETLKTHVIENKLSGKRWGNSNLGKEKPSVRGEKNFLWKNSEVARKGWLALDKKRKDGFYDDKFFYNGVYFRSSWEVNFAKWLDENDFSWAYEPCYFICGNLHHYYPDFWVDEWETFVEVKGWSSMVGSAKFDYFKENYCNAALWFDENILEFLGCGRNSFPRDE